jgi:Holliday junction resolvase-like predicted endonuclease
VSPEYRDIPLEQIISSPFALAENDNLIADSSKLYRVWDHLHGTRVLKSDAKQCAKDCIDDYGVFVKFKEWPNDPTTYAIAYVSNLTEAYFIKPESELLNEEGVKCSEYIPLKTPLKKPFYKKHTEKEYSNLIAKQLKLAGWDVETEFSLPYGRVDVFASRENEALIYEVKTDNGFTALIQALGQVLAYRKQIKGFNINCFIAVPEETESAFLKDLFTTFGVKLTTFGGVF